MKKHLKKKMRVMDAVTSPAELIKETLINFAYGFAGNSITVFISKEMDVFVIANFLFYYMFLSFIVNRAKYETRLGRFILLPGAASLGAFVGYKMALYISTII